MPKSKVKENLDGNDLDLSMSSLTAVPVKEINELPKATRVDLSCNLLTTLTLDFCTLVNVVKLDLSKNHLECLPDNFGDLQRLQSLDLYSNQLRTVPVSFFRLKSLKWLDLKDNPLCEELRSVAGDCLNENECKNCAKRVVAYMRNVQADQERRRQKQLQEERELEATRKLEEERERQKRKAEKLLEKERKRREYEAKKAVETPQSVQAVPKDPENKPSVPVRNGSASIHGKSQNSVGLSGCGALLVSLTGLILVLAFSVYYCETHRKDALCRDARNFVMPYYLPLKKTIGQYINLR